MIIFFPVFLSFALLALVGCGKSKSGEQVAVQPAHSASNRVDAALLGAGSNGVSKTIEQMAPEDVIISVNGTPLRRKDYDLAMKRIVKQISETPNAQNAQKHAMLRMAVQTFIPRFISTQLLIQDAKQRKVLGEEELRTRAEAMIAAAAKRERKELDVFKKAFVGGEEALLKEAEHSVWVSTLIATNIPPKVTVDDAFMEATYAAIRGEQAAIDATNALKIARLKGWREEIIKGTEFGTLADQHSECQRSAPGNSGYWGAFERNEFQNLKMRAAIFALKPGEVSDVLEDDEGFHLVKMLEHIPAKKNEKGRVIEPESLKLAHILLCREPAPELASPESLKADLTQQMQQQAIDAYVENLKAQAVIDYPNGTNLWTRAAKPQPKPPQPKPPQK
jgi:peptidyl-prolyl cis-trans isomerase C